MAAHSRKLLYRRTLDFTTLLVFDSCRHRCAPSLLAIPGNGAPPTSTSTFAIVHRRATEITCVDVLGAQRNQQRNRKRCALSCARLCAQAFGERRLAARVVPGFDSFRRIRDRHNDIELRIQATSLLAHRATQSIGRQDLKKCRRPCASRHAPSSADVLSLPLRLELRATCSATWRSASSRKAINLRVEKILG